MEESKTKLIVVSLVIIIIVVASLGFYLIKDGVTGITAMEGKEIADSVAFNWSDNSTLISVRIASTTGSGGQFSSWYYNYIDSHVITNDSECVEIIVYHNGDHEIWHNAGIGPHTPIFNWTIESDEAYEIAMTNDEIKSFIRHHPSVDSYFLSNASGTPTWYIAWCYDAGFDNPKWAQIEIDANTGEVLYVEADY